MKLESKPLLNDKKDKYEDLIVIIILLVLDVISDNFNSLKYISYIMIYFGFEKLIKNKNFIFPLCIYFIIFTYFENLIVKIFINLLLFTILLKKLNYKNNWRKFEIITYITIIICLIYNLYFFNYLNIIFSVSILIPVFNNNKYLNIISFWSFLNPSLNAILRVINLILIYKKEYKILKKINIKIYRVFILFISIYIIIQPIMNLNKINYLNKKLLSTNNIKIDYKYYIISNEVIQISCFNKSKLLNNLNIISEKKFKSNKLIYKIKSNFKITKIQLKYKGKILVKKIINDIHYKNSKYLGNFIFNNNIMIMPNFSINVFDATNYIQLADYNITIKDYNTSKVLKDKCKTDEYIKIYINKKHYLTTYKVLKCNKLINLDLYILPKNENLIKINKIKNIDIITKNEILLENKKYIWFENKLDFTINFKYKGNLAYKIQRVESDNGINNLMIFKNKPMFKNLVINFNKISKNIKVNDFKEYNQINMPKIEFENYEIDDFEVNKCKIDKIYFNIDYKYLDKIEKNSINAEFNNCLLKSFNLSNWIIKNFNYNIIDNINKPIKLVFNNLKIKKIAIKNFKLTYSTVLKAIFNDKIVDNLFVNYININNMNLKNINLKDYFIYINLNEDFKKNIKFNIKNQVISKYNILKNNQLYNIKFNKLVYFNQYCSYFKIEDFDIKKLNFSN